MAVLGSSPRGGSKFSLNNKLSKKAFFLYTILIMDKGEVKGHLHPMSSAIMEISDIFAEIGFSVALGPELETEFYNFDALNIPANHPSREMQDTFWLKQPKGGIGNLESGIWNEEQETKSQIQNSKLQTNSKSQFQNGESTEVKSDRKVLRTHTSPVQIRYMETHKPPIRIIAPGKVFRNEATDATHEVQFYHLEGLYVDKQVSVANLTGVLLHFFHKYLGEDVEMRFRPSFFPFVEPGIEVDVKFKGRWLEVLGAGLVHPKVLKSAGLDPKEWQGFAFGGGIDRLIMAKYGVEDVRLFYNGDLRLINQF